MNTQTFHKKSLLQRLRMPLPELEEYYLQKRQYDFEHNVPLRGIKWREWIHPLLVWIVHIDRLINRRGLVVLSDRREKIKGPILYACTHVGYHDVETVYEAIKDPAWLFLGDPKGLYHNFSGLLLYLTGVLCLDTQSKTDRGIGKQ